MRPWLPRTLGLLLLAPMLALVPQSAQAASLVWSFSEVTGAASPLQQGNATVTVTVNCASGQTPVAGWVVPSQSDDIRRLSETYGLGSGAGYSVRLQNQSAGSAIITVTPHVRCVSMGNFQAGTTITTPQQTFAVNTTTQLASGEATCPQGYQVISGSVAFAGSGGITLLTSAPSLGPGWEARGYHENDAGTMKVSANCVLAADLPGAKMSGTIVAAGWGTTAAANCPSGMSLITAGTWNVGGDGGLVTINQRLVASGATTGWTSTSIQDPAVNGFAQTRLLCMPSAYPSVVVSPNLVYTNTTSGQWTFSGTDPASAGGYSISYTCQISHPGTSEPSGPCTSPVNVSNLTEGTHSLQVTIKTSDGRSSSGSGQIVVDTTAPGVTFADAQGSGLSSSPTIKFTVADASPVGTLQCWLDTAAPATCPVGTFSDYRGLRSLALTGLSDGPHVLHVKPTDGATNTATRDLAFSVDTTAPSVIFSDPAGKVHGPSVTVGLTVADASSVPGLTCWVDAAAAAPCPTAAAGDYRGARVVTLVGLGDGAHVLHVKPTDTASNTATYDLGFAVDATGPTVSLTKPTAPFQLARSLSPSWTGSDGGSGLATYSLERRTSGPTSDFSPWATVTTGGPETLAAPSQSLVLGSTYCFSVTATDRVGNRTTTPARCTAVPLDDRSLKRSAGWTREKAKGWFQGTYVSTTTKGAQLSTSGTVTRLALVAQKCSKCGTVGVYVGRTLVQKVNLKSSRTTTAMILLPAVALRSGKVAVKVLTSGRPVRIDALGLSRQ